MPHIRAVYLDTPENRKVRAFLKEQKTLIRANVAEALGYPAGDVALYPHRVDAEIADNLLPLEFVIDSGTRTLGREDELSGDIKQRLLDNCPGAADIHFGIWLVSHPNNDFTEHKPR